MNFRDRLEQSREKIGNNTGAIIAAELEEGFSCEYFATDNIKSYPPCIDLRLSNGRRKGVPYFNMWFEYDDSGNIEMTTANIKITITGRDLVKLYDYLVANRVRYIQAGIGSDPQNEGLYVEDILIEEVII